MPLKSQAGAYTRRLFVALLAVLAFVVGIGLAARSEDDDVRRQADAIRAETAAREARWATALAQQYRQRQARNPGSLTALNSALPEAEIPARDPWGREWTLSPAFVDASLSPQGDLWACSRGPLGTSPCPARLVTLPAPSAAERAIPWVNRGLLLSAVALPLILGVLRLSWRRGTEHPASWVLPAATVVVIAGAFGIVVGFGMCCTTSRAILARVDADVRMLTAAVEAHRAHTGTVPGTLTDLTRRIAVGGQTAGPFFTRLPDAPTHHGWRYRYRRSSEGVFVLTAEGPLP